MLQFFLGHTRLMDVEMPKLPEPKGDGREAVVVARKSHAYFTGPLRKLKCPSKQVLQVTEGTEVIDLTILMTMTSITTARP